MLEPGPHARLGHGFGNPRGRQLRRVVLDPQPLADHVGVERFEPGERLQPMLEDRDFLVAVHPLDLEDRLGVQLANGTVSHGPLLLDVRQRLLEQLDDVVIVERVKDEPSRRGAGERDACRASAGADAKRRIR